VSALIAVVAWGSLATRGSGSEASLAEVSGAFEARFNHDASRVIVRTRGGMVGLWDVASGAAVPCDLHTKGEGMVMSADGRNVFVSSEENGARIFFADTGGARSPRLKVRVRNVEYPEAIFSPDGRYVVVFESDATKVFVVESGDLHATIPFRASAVGDDQDVAPTAIFSRDGSQCFIMDAGGLVVRYDAATWKPVGAPMRHPAAPSAYSFRFAVSKDSRWLATFDNPGENGPKAHLQTWDVASGKAVGKPIVVVNGITGTFFSAARLLVSPGRGEGSVRELPSLKSAFGIRAHDDVDGPAIALSPDEKWILSWGADRNMRLLNSAKGSLQESGQFNARISQVLMLPDSSGCLVTFDNAAFLSQNHYDHYVIKLGFPDMEPTHSLRVTEPMSDATLSPDGRRFLVFVGKTDQERVCVYETADFKPVGPKQGTADGGR
jgi:WD40 repeat protein